MPDAFCPMCTETHTDWRVLTDTAGYYAEVGAQPTGPIVQCRRCEFRLPFARRVQKAAETRTIVQEYEQQGLW